MDRSEGRDHPPVLNIPFDRGLDINQLHLILQKPYMKDMMQ